MEPICPEKQTLAFIKTMSNEAYTEYKMVVDSWPTMSVKNISSAIEEIEKTTELVRKEAITLMNVDNILIVEDIISNLEESLGFAQRVREVRQRQKQSTKK